MPDEIALTIPADRDFHGVAHLVLGGLASRLNITLEQLEDLQLAIDAVLGETPVDDDVTVTMSLDGDVLLTRIGPVDLNTALERDGDAIGLQRVLDTVVDDVLVEDDWVQLAKRVTVNG
jgi:hypothetical protein